MVLAVRNEQPIISASFFVLPYVSRGRYSLTDRTKRTESPLLRHFGVFRRFRATVSIWMVSIYTAKLREQTADVFFTACVLNRVTVVKRLLLLPSVALDRILESGMTRGANFLLCGYFVSHWC